MATFKSLFACVLLLHRDSNP